MRVLGKQALFNRLLRDGTAAEYHQVNQQDDREFQEQIKRVRWKSLITRTMGRNHAVFTAGNRPEVGWEYKNKEQQEAAYDGYRSPNTTPAGLKLLRHPTHLII